MITHLHRITVRAVVVASLGFAAIVLTAPEVSAAPTPVPVGQAPEAEITLPKTVYAGVPITLSGAGSTAQGGVSEWDWDLNGRGGFETSSSSTPWVSKSFTAGKHTVKLRVRGLNGLVASTSKTFTAKPPPAAVSEPTEPTQVTADADGTTVNVTWVAPLGITPLAYRVSNADDSDTDPIYVPATSELTASFDDLVPGTYRVTVAAVNGEGAGPATAATAEVLRKGSSSASPTATASTGATSGATTAADPTASATDAPSADTSNASSTGPDRDTIGIVFIALGGVVLLGAAVAGTTAAVRRRRSA